MYVSEQWRSTYSEPEDLTTGLTTSGTFSATDKNVKTFLNRPIILYSIIAGSIVVMVALASCCFKYKRENVHLNKSRTPRTHRDRVSSERSNAQYIRNNESAYDLIDEDNMIGNETLMRSIIRDEYVNQSITTNVAIVDEDVSSDTYSGGDVADPPNDDYLNPYQPMIEVDIHCYRLLESESTPKSKEIFERRSESRIISAVQVNEYVHHAVRTTNTSC
ncbi:Hypothetical predicted protein [Mytilus galloprovincialis]|uniref:Uncharacterized protein n=1 Tax=Mytilus galloprovincialis TaxID=29158 RepID=A0A8B6FDN2_MYTGA|nr:Hypothetical predicted protein [Mytilus galloprovincialis]